MCFVVFNFLPIVLYSLSKHTRSNVLITVREIGRPVEEANSTSIVTQVTLAANTGAAHESTGD